MSIQPKSRWPWRRRGPWTLVRWSYPLMIRVPVIDYAACEPSWWIRDFFWGVGNTSGPTSAGLVHQMSIALALRVSTLQTYGSQVLQRRS